MIIIWYSASKNTYGYSPKNEFMKMLLSSDYGTDLSKVQELEGLPDTILSRLIDEMNKQLKTYY